MGGNSVNTRTVCQKLKSTKLWTALAGISVGVAIALGADAGDIDTIAGAVTAVLSVVAYIVTEGKVDAESVKTAVGSAQEAVEAVSNADKH